MCFTGQFGIDSLDVGKDSNKRLDWLTDWSCQDFPLSCSTKITVKILNIRTPKKFAVITIKSKQDGFTKE